MTDAPIIDPAALARLDQVGGPGFALRIIGRSGARRLALPSAADLRALAPPRRDRRRDRRVFAGRRILVIDDESDSRIVLRQYLEDLGCEVRTVGQGRKGIAEAHMWRPHLLTLDLRLPEMDGAEVVRRLASDAELSGISGGGDQHRGE